MFIPETGSIFRRDLDSHSFGLLCAEEHLLKALELLEWSIDTRTLLGNIDLDNVRTINVPVFWTFTVTKISSSVF
jgi:hypothetical protein